MTVCVIHRPFHNPIPVTFRQGEGFVNGRRSNSADSCKSWMCGLEQFNGLIPFIRLETPDSDERNRVRNCYVNGVENRDDRQPRRVAVSFAGDEAQLISSCRLGDPEAWAQVWRRYYGLVAHLVRSSGFFKPDEVEEICQEVFISLLDALERFEGRGTLKTLIRVIAKRRIVDAVRVRIRHIEMAAVAIEGNPDENPETVQPFANADQFQRTVLHHVQDVVERELNALPEECRRLIQLRYLQGYKLREIGKLLDRPLGSIGTQLQRCLAKLHAACLQHEPEMQAVEPLLESWENRA